MRLESKGLKRVLILLFSLLPPSLVLLSCGATPSASTQTSGLKYRALISNNVSAGTLVAGVYILDAQKDMRGNTSPLSAGNNPGMMVVAPNLAQTLAFSSSGTQGSDNQLTFINNAAETASNHLTLPGLTESIVISPDSSSAYAAVPTAQVIGQSPGLVEAISMGGTAFTGQVAIPSVHYLSIDHGGNRILGFSDNSDSVAVITPSEIGIGNAVSYLGGFDRPVAAFFSSDDSTAYVVNCGAECGGNQASVQKVDLTLTQCLPTGVCPAVPACVTDANHNLQCAASVAMVSGSTMYLAGTPYTAGGGPSLTCLTGTTQAQYCGLLTVFDLGQMAVTNSAPIFITDGYHNRIALGANGQLYIGARTCTEIIPPIPPPPGAEVRGCLSIFNTLGTAVGAVQPGGVLIPPENGDVTGLDPIGNRSVVYVVQGGSLLIYDDTTDALYNNPNDANNPGKIASLVGQFSDVKTIDF
jgi:hypothetical protein